MYVRKFEKEAWKQISKEIHAYSFGEKLEPDEETISFALMAVKNDEPQSYCTIIELDKNTCYMQHGGALPASQGTINVAKSYAMMVLWIKEKYPRITTRIKNDNIKMIKLALSAGFVIIGVEMYEDGIFLSLINNSEIKNDAQ